MSCEDLQGCKSTFSGFLKDVIANAASDGDDGDGDDDNISDLENEVEDVMMMKHAKTHASEGLLVEYATISTDCSPRVSDVCYLVLSWFIGPPLAVTSRTSYSSPLGCAISLRNVFAEKVNTFFSTYRVTKRSDTSL